MRMPMNPALFWGAADDTAKERFCLVLLSTSVLVCYGNTLLNGFAMDDIGYIVRNPQVTDPSLAGLFAAHRVGNVFRPLTFATYALDWKVGGGIALGFHVVNLILHAAVSCLVFLLVEALVDGSRHARAVALAAAALFAVHPIHTEAVTSIVGRAELLAAGFLIVAWILHLQDREIPALVCFALALLSKESAVVFLPLVMIGDYVRGKWRPRLRYWRIAGVTVMYLAVLWNVQGGRFGPAHISDLDNSLLALPAGLRILNALRIAWKYVGLQFYPRTLSCDYSYNQIPLYAAWRYTLPAAVSALATVAAWIWTIKKRQLGPALAGAIYLVSFAITANIIKPIGTIMAERLVYLPSVGFCVLIALAWNWLRERQRGLAWGMMGVLLTMLGVRTIVRNRDWEDNRTLAAAQVRAAPNSAKTHQNIAMVYMERKELALAQKELDTELQIYPLNPIALATYGLLESWQGHYQAAGVKLEEAFYMMRRDDPAYDETAVNLAELYVRTDHLDGALELLNQEIAKSPRYDRAWAIRALLHYKRSEMLAARADAETALRLDPSDSEARKVMQWLNAPTQPPANGPAL
jgi:protein O-mannosyl-transferase